jgi:O-antigen/teichoic acid export membrane protein
MSLRSVVRSTLAAIQSLLDRDQGLGRRLMGGALWLTVGAGVSSGATLLSSIVLARLLGITGFGNYTILMTTLGVVVMFAGPSLGWTSSKYVSELRHADPDKAARVITLTNITAFALSLLFALVMVFGSGFLVREVLKVPSLRSELMVAAIAVLLTGINGAQRGTLAGFHLFSGVALVNVIRGLLFLLLLFPLARPYGIMGAIVAQGIAVAGSCVVASLAIRREMVRLKMPLFRIPQREDWAIFQGFTIPAYFMSVATILSSWVVGVIVVRSENGSYQMGVFGIASQIFLACMFLPSMVSQPCLPLLSEQLQRGRDGLRSVRRLLILMISLSFGLTSLLGAALLLSGHTALAVFGEGLEAYYFLMLLTILTAVLAASIGPLNYYMTARGDMWYAFILSVLGTVANIGALLALRHSGAAMGAVWGRFLSYLVITPPLLVYLIRSYRRSTSTRSKNTITRDDSFLTGVVSESG